MKIKKIFIAIIAVFLLSMIFINGYRPVRNMMSHPSPWEGNSTIKSKLPVYDSAKKTVFIIADYKLTEMFDMLAPFYLFNATEKANVYIVAKEKTPILIKRNLFVTPQLTFREVDSMRLNADVIVIPAMSIRDEHQDTSVIAWIKKHFTPETKMLTICDGASTGAATGLYDGKSITAHASDMEVIKAHFSKPSWVQNVSVAKDGNLFSTAGVSNAVEGSLTVIDEMFGRATAQKVMIDIHYPHSETKSNHQSIELNGRNKFAVVRKILFRKNRDIGVLLENGINEFAMAATMDTYGRTFPASFKTCTLHDSIIRTRYGLSIISTGNNSIEGLDELHVIMPEAFTKADQFFFRKVKTIIYENQRKQYLFDVYLNRIGKKYGNQFEQFVKVSLDYN